MKNRYILVGLLVSISTIIVAGILFTAYKTFFQMEEMDCVGCSCNEAHPFEYGTLLRSNTPVRLVDWIVYENGTVFLSLTNGVSNDVYINDISIETYNKPCVKCSYIGNFTPTLLTNHGSKSNKQSSNENFILGFDCSELVIKRISLKQYCFYVRINSTIQENGKEYTQEGRLSPEPLD